MATLERLGGALVAPRAAVRAIAQGGPGGLSDIVPWLILLACAASPERLGKALLVARVDAAAGVGMLSRAFVATWAPLVIALAAVALVASLIGAVSGFNRALDAAALLAAPVLLLTAVGVLLEQLAGVDVSWLPHHPLRWGRPGALVRWCAGYGWSTLLWLGLILRARKTSS